MDIPTAHRGGYVAPPGTLRHLIDQRIQAARVAYVAALEAQAPDVDRLLRRFEKLCRERSRIVARGPS